MRRSLVLVLLLLSSLLTGLAPKPARAAVPAREFHYVTVSDGEEIAVSVSYPPDYVGGRKYPVLYTTEGYGGAGQPNDSSRDDDHKGYVLVAASLRGTGCSSGQLDLFSQRSSLDGKEVIDNWLPTQKWFNGRVGLFGHSYGGLSGFLLAAQAPKHLVATAVSGLIDDFYRGILYPGGVPNAGFPILWGAGVRPALEHQGNADELAADQHCRENYLDHQGSDAVTVGALLDTYPNRQAGDETWAIQTGLLSHIGGIRAPIQMGQQYQDEQTGPRGANILWEHVPAGVPKRLVLSTGRHNPNDPTDTKKDWLDCWVLHGGSRTARAMDGTPCRDVVDPHKRVLAHFESMGDDRLTPYVTTDWPFKETSWQRYHLRADGILGVDPGPDGAVQYVSTTAGRGLTGDFGALGPGGTAPITYTPGLPDTARFELPFDRTTAVAGPSVVTLYASTTSADVDFFVEVLDLDQATGDTTFVQRGLLRASFAATLDPKRSSRIRTGPHRGEMYRPYYRFVDSTLLTPLQAVRFEIEVFPFGHIFRAGHSMILQIHAPPTNDPISTYAYEPNQAGVVTIFQEGERRSSILLPFMRRLPPIRPVPPDCGEVVGEICVTPALG